MKILTDRQLRIQQRAVYLNSACACTAMCAVTTGVFMLTPYAIVRAFVISAYFFIFMLMQHYVSISSRELREYRKRRDFLIASNASPKDGADDEQTR